MKIGQNKYWDLQSINVKIASLKLTWWWKNVFVLLTDLSRKIKGFLKKWRNLTPIHN